MIVALVGRIVVQMLFLQHRGVADLIIDGACCCVTLQYQCAFGKLGARALFVCAIEILEACRSRVAGDHVVQGAVVR